MPAKRGRGQSTGSPRKLPVTQSLGAVNLIPEKYRRLIRTVETNEPVAADYDFPDALTGNQSQVILARQEIDKARLKIIEEVIDIDADPLTGHELSEWGSMIITESIVDDGTAIDTGFSIVKSTVTPLGNGKSIKITVQFPANLASLALLKKTIGQDNLIPEKYRRLVQHTETHTEVATSYSMPTSLAGNQSQIEYAEESIYRARLKVTEEIIGSISALTGGESNEWGPLVINESIVDDGTNIDTGFLILKSTVSPLGNGKSVKITAHYPSDLAGRALINKSIGQQNLIPEKYRGLVTHTETIKLVDSTYTFPSALTGDQAEITKQQLTIDQARLKIVEEIIASGSSLAGQELDKYGVLSIAESIVDDGTAADTGFLIKTSRVTPLGNGKSIKITVSYPSDLASVVLAGTKVDDQTLIEIPLTEQIVTAGTAGGVSGSVISEVDWIDRYRSIKRTRTTPSNADLAALNRTYPTVVNHVLPDVLLSASIIAAYGATSGDITSIDFGLQYDLQRGYRGPCDGTIQELYTNGPPSSGLPTVTKFFPREHRLVMPAVVAASASVINARVVEFTIPYSLHDKINLTEKIPELGRVSGVVMTFPGSYRSAPSVYFSGGGGSGAGGVGILNASGGVIGVLITSVGAGYTSPPDVRFDGGSGGGAQAKAFITGAALSIPATNPISLPGSGTLIVIDVDPKPWRDNVYRTIITRIKIP